MIQIMKDNHEDYALLPLSDYMHLLKLARVTREDEAMIKRDDLLFLSAVMEALGATSESELAVIEDVVIIRVKTKKGGEIHSRFSLDLCEKYYNRVSKFIDEVL